MTFNDNEFDTIADDVFSVSSDDGASFVLERLGDGSLEIFASDRGGHDISGIIPVDQVARLRLMLG
jgi:hypothetical protein